MSGLGCVRGVVLALVMGLSSFSVAQSVDAAGEAIYKQWCAACHEGQVEKAPHVSSLKTMSPDIFMSSLTQGAMLLQAQMLSKEDRDALARYLVGVAQYERTPVALQHCSVPLRVDASQSSHLVWGSDLANTRYFQSDQTGFSVSDASRLQLDWAFVLPHANRARSQPAVIGEVLVTGTQDGTVYALNRDTGCVYWEFRAKAEVRTGITVDPVDVAADQRRVYFGDFLGRVYAVNLLSGELVWSVTVDAHPTATITAQPQLYDGVLYVSVSSREFLAGADASYACCTFRGSVVALDTATGGEIWKTYSIAEVPAQVGVSAAGVARFAPSGAPIWNTPTIDPERGLLYVGTGENYTRPTSETSDAILAMQLSDGNIRWVRQTLADDAWNVACTAAWKDKTNCPDPGGPDLDYGSPPILVQGESGDILVAGQKSGVVYGIDPDTGELLWETRVGRGGGQGGIHFGMAAAAGKVFVPVNDFDFSENGYPASPGLYALDAFSGKLIWSVAADDVCGEMKSCWRGLSSPVSVMDGVVFAGHSDGRIRAHSTEDGALLWEYQTVREYTGVDGRVGKGGSIGGGAGPVMIDGALYLNSGYGTFKHMEGNVLLRFSPAELNP